MKLGKEVGLGPGHTVLDGDTDPLSKRDTTSQFPAHVCCGQTAGWIKMPLGTEVGLGPDDMGTPLPPKEKGAQHSPNSGPCLL